MAQTVDVTAARPRRYEILHWTTVGVWVCFGLCTGDRSVVSADAPPGRYIYPAAEIVQDTVTKLTWQRNPDSVSRSQSDAITYCKNLSLEGGGWRLPTRAELLSLIDPTRNNPALDPKAFPHATSAPFWSSSAYVQMSGDAWYVDAAAGEARGQSNTTTYSVRCVRD